MCRFKGIYLLPILYNFLSQKYLSRCLFLSEPIIRPRDSIPRSAVLPLIFPLFSHTNGGLGKCFPAALRLLHLFAPLLTHLEPLHKSRSTYSQERCTTLAWSGAAGHSVPHSPMMRLLAARVGCLLSPLKAFAVLTDDRYRVQQQATSSGSKY